MAKVMLVEDDDNLREIYEARLAAEGYEIVTANNGEDALVVAKEHKPDLIISDVMMPNISGFDMLDILRNTDGLHDVKVIMLTALGQSDDKQRAEKLGADRYLVKSQVTLEDIVNAASELINGDDLAPETSDVQAAPQTAVQSETPAHEEIALGAPVEPATPAAQPAPAPPALEVPVADPAAALETQPSQQPPVATPQEPTVVQPAAAPPVTPEVTAPASVEQAPQVIQPEPAAPAEQPVEAPAPISSDTAAAEPVESLPPAPNFDEPIQPTAATPAPGPQPETAIVPEAPIETEQDSAPVSISAPAAPTVTDMPVVEAPTQTDEPSQVISMPDVIEEVVKAEQSLDEAVNTAQPQPQTTPETPEVISPAPDVQAASDATAAIQSTDDSTATDTASTQNGNNSATDELTSIESAPSLEINSPATKTATEGVDATPDAESINTSTAQSATSEEAAMQQRIDNFVATSPISTPEFDPEKFEATDESGQQETLESPQPAAEPLPEEALEAIEEPAVEQAFQETLPAAEQAPAAQPEQSIPGQPQPHVVQPTEPAAAPPAAEREPAQPQVATPRQQTGGNKVIQPISGGLNSNGPSLDELLAKEADSGFSAEDAPAQPAPPEPNSTPAATPQESSQNQPNVVQPGSTSGQTVFDPDDPSSVAL